MTNKSPSEPELSVTRQTVSALSQRSWDLWNSLTDEHVPGVLYHYTSISTLFSILSGQTLHLGHVDQMNDPEELAYFDGVFRKAVARYASTPDGGSGFFSGYYERGLNNIEPNRDTFAFCMSELPDAMSQWQMYGDSCKGIAIGIDLKKSWDGLKQNIYSDRGIALGMGKVRYEPEEQLSCALAFIASWDRFYQSHWTKDTGVSQASDVAFAKVMGGEQRKLASYIKAPCWASEREWRLVASINSDDLGKLAGTKLHRSTRSAYVIVSFRERAQADIVSLIIGPLSTLSMHSSGLRCQLAKSHLLPSVVSKSGIAMRWM